MNFSNERIQCLLSYVQGGTPVPNETWIELLTDLLQERENRRRARENAKTLAGLADPGTATVVQSPARNFDVLVDLHNFLDRKLREHRCSAGAANYTRAKRRALRWVLHEVSERFPSLQARWLSFAASLSEDKV